MTVDGALGEGHMIEINGWLGFVMGLGIGVSLTYYWLAHSGTFTKTSIYSTVAKVIVVACNSACAAGLDQVREVHPEIPIIGVEPAHEQTQNGKIGVLATSLTLNGPKFSTQVEKYGSDIAVYTQPAPGLVELVEAGKLDTAEAEALLHQYLDPMLRHQVDMIVLGCTHFPFCGR
jgi:glutamate racemase